MTERLAIIAVHNNELSRPRAYYDSVRRDTLGGPWTGDPRYATRFEYDDAVQAAEDYTTYARQRGMADVFTAIEVAQ